MSSLNLMLMVDLKFQTRFYYCVKLNSGIIKAYSILFLLTASCLSVSVFTACIITFDSFRCCTAATDLSRSIQPFTADSHEKLDFWINAIEAELTYRLRLVLLLHGQRRAI